MAIGLANTTTAQFPYAGATVASVIFAAVAIFETMGPPIVARALRWSGDAPAAGTSSPPAAHAHPGEPATETTKTEETGEPPRVP